MSLLRDVGKLAAACLAAALASAALRFFLAGMPPFVVLAACGTLFAVVYLAAIHLLRIPTQDEYEQIRDAIGRYLPTFAALTGWTDGAPCWNFFISLRRQNGNRSASALMLDSLTLPAWAASIVDHIQSLQLRLRIESLIFNASEQPPPAQPASLPVRLWRILRDERKRSQILYSLYFKWDAQRYSIPNDPLRPVDCTDKLAACLENIRGALSPKGSLYRFSPQDLEIVQEQKLDVILRFGFNILRGEILNVPRYGIWSYHHGDNAYYRGGPAYFWEIYESHPLSGVILAGAQRRVDAGLVLCKVPTWRHNRACPPCATGSSRTGLFRFFVIRKLHQLHQYGHEQVAQQSSRTQLVAGRKKLYRSPTNIQMLRFLINWAFRRAVPVRLRPVPYSYWRVALRVGENPLRLDAPDPRGFQWVKSPRGHFYADPVLFEKGGKTWLFFEDYSYLDKTGMIGCAEVLPDGVVSAPRTVLAPGHHLSYPFVFEHQSEIYMLPESGADQIVALYRAHPFPDRWSLEKVLFKGTMAVDTTLWVEDGVYWFFVTMVDPPEAGPQLFLFYADSLVGEWNYHPSNPICTDVRFARGAGRIFRENGRLIRPSQDHSRGYGSACHFRHVLELTKHTYREVSLGSIQPTWERGLTGTHTYNRCGKFEVLDANRPTPLRKVL